ncbi:hypothetical protein J7E49_06990 [Variovorax paradoxus]|nr:hypothetical protein [Variovorax paradoxus]
MSFALAKKHGRTRLVPPSAFQGEAEFRRRSGELIEGNALGRDDDVVLHGRSLGRSALCWLMTPEDLRFLSSTLGSAGAGGLVSGAIVWLIVRHHLASYLTEKGKNLATKEDVAEITREVEGVKIGYAMISEHFKAEHQLRIAALDKRLQAAQEAYTLWRQLVEKAHGEDAGWAVLECQGWWDQNCLYLDEAARDAFSQSIFSAGGHRGLLKSRASAELVKENWNDVIAAGDIIVRSVALPGLTTMEKQRTGLPLK